MPVDDPVVDRGSQPVPEASPEASPEAGTGRSDAEGGTAKEQNVPDRPAEPAPEEPARPVLPATPSRPPSAAASQQPAPSPAPAAAMQPPALKGNLEKTPFEKVLFYLLKKKGTGMLTASRDDEKRIFFFVRGGLLDVETGPGDGDFGGFLSRKGLVDEVELRQYRERRKEGGDPRDIFIKMGCLTPQRLQEENLLFLHEVLVDCFTWTSGSVLFEWSPSFLQELSSASAFMSLLFYRGFKAKMTPEMISGFMDEKNGFFPAKSAEFYEYQNHLAGQPGSAVLDLVDGRRTCSDIVNSTEADDAAVMLYTLDYLKALSYGETPVTSEAPPPFPLRERAVPQQAKEEQESFEDLGGALSALEDEVEALGSIKPSPAAPGGTGGEGLSGLEQDLRNQWEAIKDKNYYEIFGMKQNAFSFDKCKKAYFDFTRTYGPDKFFASSSETMNLAEEFLSKISNAYETLSNVVSKENYDEMLSQQEQVPSAADDKEFYEQIQFQSGKVFVEQGQYESAEKAFTNCLNIDPNKPEYLAYLALAIYNNPANRANPAARKRAKDMVNKSLQLGKLSIAYALKGTIYLDEGGVNFAEAEFNKALKLNPNNKTALKKLEQIKAKREEEKKGLFQRMFK
jgi:curved DNA-binding protein CbpA